ncbi:MAG: hypothetical protein A2V59_11155 [Armatimonadetes bacterium RBG_19FT_COMBO_69_19]|nr:MAG: hypothetical protein A2V59_11155 [Armatimonadetes bacterium RBG_19FT_COMBO_69_19]
MRTAPEVLRELRALATPFLALRQIGKRSPGLRREAIRTARGLMRSDSRSARWIARDALRELER